MTFDHDISEYGVTSVREMILSGRRSAEEVARRHIEWIAESDKEIGAFLTVMADEAIERARAVDREIRGGAKPGRLAGVPVAIKDVFATHGIRTTCGSRILSSYKPPFSATAVGRIMAEGGVVIGKTNMDEFAMGSSTESSAFFPTRNPWDFERVPGGSSGGSAAAVAAGHAVAALGSDTGGSVRQPAALCGVVGLKPTYGRVSRYGLIAFASSLDHVGILARTVDDCAAVLEVIAGGDPNDSTCAPEPVPAYTESGMRGDFRVGVLPEKLIDKLDPGARSVFLSNVEAIRQMGATIGEATMPHWDYSLPAYYILATSEASSNLARYDGVKYGHRSSTYENLHDMYCRSRTEGFGAEVKRRIILGTYSLSSGYYAAYYLRACRIRTLVMRDFAENFGRFDLLVMPTTPGPAFRLGDRVDDPVQMYLSDVFTVAANLAGVPAISVPSGFVDGLPVGLQLVGPHFSEAKIFQLARAFERAVSLPVRIPPMAAACRN